MTSTLQTLRDFLAGLADEKSAEFVRDGLGTPGSAIRQFFDEGRAIAQLPFALDWNVIGEALNDLDDAPEGEEDAEMQLPGEQQNSLGIQRVRSPYKTKLERLRERLAGSHNEGTAFSIQTHGLQPLEAPIDSDLHRVVVPDLKATPLLPVLDLEDDVDIPNGRVLHRCTITGKYWHLPLNTKKCPGCGLPLESHDAEIGIKVS